MTEKMKTALKAIARTLAAGQRILFVIGAGSSTGAGIPLMRHVYSCLVVLCKEQLQTTKAALDAIPNDQLSDKHSILVKECCHRLEAMFEDLSRLAADDAPRSVSARVLGTLQMAAKQIRKDPFDTACAQIWITFSNKFFAGTIPTEVLNERSQLTDSENIERGAFWDVCTNDKVLRDIQGVDWRSAIATERISVGPYPLRTPTVFHHFAAALAVTGRAYTISLNFDGLSRRAIDSVAKLTFPAENVPAVVCSNVTGVENFLHGAESDAGNVVPVFKIWGDVFHAVCVNPRCPDCESRTPMFTMTSDAESQQLKCPACGGVRQLEIFFAGYEEKEIKSEAMLRVLLSSLSPQVGCVVTVGVSGLWDRALGEFIFEMCSAVETYDVSVSSATEVLPSCICVDPKTSFLVDELTRRNVRILHLACSADEFSLLFEPVSTAKQQPAEVPHQSSHTAQFLQDGWWDKALEIANSKSRPQKEPWDPQPARIYALLRGADVDDRHYLDALTRLQQLGIKTRMCASEPSLIGNHNRQRHSLGATTLALLWSHSLQEKLKASSNMSRTEGMSSDIAAAITLLAVRHHDVGHLPFTHLMEEVFDEVHWMTRDWGERFRHDEPVLIGLADCLEEDVAAFYGATELKPLRDECEPFRGMLDKDKAEFIRHLSEMYCQARSGKPWVDAIINSPLDVDKLDYVFRDCHYLNQGLHVKGFNSEDALKWASGFFQGCHVLPSGFLAISGDAGEKAREFLQERVWLYRNAYFRPAFRALERIVRHAVTQWLLRVVTKELSDAKLRPDLAYSDGLLKDTRALKGRLARDLVWDLVMTGSPGTDESNVVMTMIDATLMEGECGVPLDSLMRDWLLAAKNVLSQVFSSPCEHNLEQLMGFIHDCCGVEVSERLFIQSAHLQDAREIIRQLEQESPCEVLFDMAVLPRVLAYPSSREFRYMGKRSVGECIVVPSEDPDRWHLSARHWVPLSQSRFAACDEHRWGAIMAVALDRRKDKVRQGMDRLRLLLRTSGIQYDEKEPRFLV